MKRIFTLTAVLAIAFQAAIGQSLVQKAEAFRVDVLPAYNTYFSASGLTQGDQLKLDALESYTRMSRDSRTAVMNNLIKTWQETLVVVQYGTVKELWGWDSNSREAVLIDTWDSDPGPVTAGTPEPLSNTELHPWFFYIGSAQRFDSDKNINGALSARAGVFLLMDKWDIAATFSEQISGNIESEDVSLQTSIGVMTKIYYPITKYNFSPFAGAEAAVLFVKGGKPAFTPSILAGMSWFVGSGSLDVGVRAGNSTSLMVGFTVIPKYR
jgi:hypothetical protein